jgi:hypothetical protein
MEIYSVGRDEIRKVDFVDINAENFRWLVYAYWKKGASCYVPSLHVSVSASRLFFP